MILPNNLDTLAKTNTSYNESKEGLVGTTTLNLELVDTITIKKETYYKMKFILNSLDRNWAIKKRNNVFYLKNLDNSTKEIITEDYLNKRVIQKIYNINSANTSVSTKEVLNKEKEKEKEKDTGNLDICEIKEKREIKNKKKEDIVPLQQGILALKERIDNGKMDANSGKDDKN